jgi:beta-lactamase superfamily II metal-dependent hydrolase
MANDYFEIDFLAVETAKSGDAITIRYHLDNSTKIHVVDGGYADTGESLINHINTHYGRPSHIDNVVLTHPDGDHANGLKVLLNSDEFTIGTLRMNRPWLYAEELLPHFKNYNSVDRLRSKLREIYSHTAELEELAEAKGITILETFQGAQIGAFTVLAPSGSRYLDLILDSDRTPERVGVEESAFASFFEGAVRTAKAAVNLVRAAWGQEAFSPNATSRENEMSIVQYAKLNGERLVLTADAGRETLAEAAEYAPWANLFLPGVDRMQVPHHGSRRNVSSEILDTWLGPKLPEQPAVGSGSFNAFISSAKDDPHHPRKSVIRGFQHRGANVFATEGSTISTQSGAPSRPGWTGITALEYPDEQEE